LSDASQLINLALISEESLDGSIDEALWIMVNEITQTLKDDIIEANAMRSKKK
jgi:hypothetical protein